MDTPTVIKPGGASPIPNNVSSTPTLPPGSIVDTGGGPKVTPNPGGVANTGDTALYSRIGDVPSVNKIPTNVEMNAQQAPLRANADTARAAESAVEFVNGVADKKIQDFSSGAGANNVGRANALVANLGGVGSPGATDRESVATGGNKKVTDAMNVQRAARIAQIYGALDQATNANNDAYQKNLADDNTKTASESEKRASSVLTSLATELGNVSYSQFRQADPATYKKILDLAGGDDAKLELLYNSAISDPNAKSTYHWENGQAFQQIGGNMKRRPDLDTKTPAAQTGSSKVENIGGTLFNFPVDANGHYQIDPSKPVSDYMFKGTTPGQFKATPKPKGPTVAPTPDEVSKIGGIMASVKGSDHYVSPEDWQNGLDEWIAAGHSTASFITNFKGYANPKDTYAGLAGNKKATGSSASSTLPIGL